MTTQWPQTTSLTAAIFAVLQKRAGDKIGGASAMALAQEIAQEVESALLRAAVSAPEYSPSTKAGVVRRRGGPLTTGST